MLDYYYISNNIYQFSYSEPIYKILGGEFFAWTRNTHIKLLQHFFLKASGRSSLGIFPKVHRIDRYHLPSLSGVLIANSLHELGYDRKRMTSVLMYHGTSDKIPRVPQHVANQFDYYLLSGLKNEMKLSTAAGIDLDSTRLVRVGNWMFDRIINEDYDKDKIRARFGIKDASYPTILYAPTWKYGGGTLLANFQYFVETIPRNYNLIIRPHSADTRHIYKLIRLIPKGYRKRVRFARPAHIFRKNFIDNLIIADLLISDTSSMIYEYLIMCRPIIICDTVSDDVEKKDDVMSIPLVVDHYKKGDNIMALIQKNLDDKTMKDDLDKLLHKCFYFNDGKSTERCVEFLRNMSLI